MDKQNKSISLNIFVSECRFSCWTFVKKIKTVEIDSRINHKNKQLAGVLCLDFHSLFWIVVEYWQTKKFLLFDSIKTWNGVWWHFISKAISRTVLICSVYSSDFKFKLVYQPTKETSKWSMFYRRKAIFDANEFFSASECRSLVCSCHG